MAWLVASNHSFDPLPPPPPPPPHPHPARAAGLATLNFPAAFCLLAKGPSQAEGQYWQKKKFFSGDKHFPRVRRSRLFEVHDYRATTTGASTDTSTSTWIVSFIYLRFL
jgi:hypothetical protein